MSLEVITNIKKAEKQAEDIIKNAEQEAKEIIAKAQDEALIAVTNTMEQFGHEMADVIKKAEAQAQTEAKQITQDMKNKCAFLNESASKHMSKAIDFVAKEIQGS